MEKRHFSLRGKIILLGVLLPAILVMVLFKMYATDFKKQAVNSFVKEARAICLVAEATRGEVEKNWQLGIFNLDMISRYANQAKMDQVLAMVPVFGAWNAAMAKAEEGGGHF